MKYHSLIFRKVIYLFIVYLASNYIGKAGDAVSIYTPYTKVSVPPGESVDYSIDIKNNGSELKKINLNLSGLPKDWNYSLKAGSYSIKQISILPGDKKSISLKIQIPLKVNKGDYPFKLIAGNLNELLLIINVSEKGTYKTEFLSDQVNMVGHSKSNFNFTTRLKNQTGEKQMYSLQAAAPYGWSVIFKPNNKQATAVEVEANATSNIYIEIKPPYNITAGNYKIPVRVINSATSAEIELEVVITGSYEIELTTPTGLLSSNITAGKEKRLELLVKNTGSSELKNIVFRSSKPKNWDVLFNPDTLKQIPAGGSSVVYATIKAYDKAIPGDYAAHITAQNPEAISNVSLRVSVKTPLLWGWMGIFIIILTIGVIFYIFRKYGRR